MALRTPLSVTPHLYMGDSTGRPLDKGVVYFGEQDKDPEFYPINLFSDDALTKPLMQPVHTKGGYLYDKGDMVEPHAKEIIYSVKVLDSYGRKVFYKGAMMRNSWNDDVIEQINDAVFAASDEAKAIFEDAAEESKKNAQSMVNDAINNTAVEGGVLADTFVTVTANGVGSIPRTLRDKLSENLTVHDYGAKGDGVTDDTLSIMAAISHTGVAYLVEGKSYLITDEIEIPEGCSVSSGMKRADIKTTRNDKNMFILNDRSGLENVNLHMLSGHTTPDTGAIKVNYHIDSYISTKCQVNNVDIIGSPWGVGLTRDSGNGIVMSGTGKAIAFCTFNNVFMRRVSTGVYIKPASAGAYSNSNVFHNLNIISSVRGLWLEGSSANIFTSFGWNQAPESEEVIYCTGQHNNISGFFYDMNEGVYPYRVAIFEGSAISNKITTTNGNLKVIDNTLLKRNWLGLNRLDVAGTVREQMEIPAMWLNDENITNSGKITAYNKPYMGHQDNTLAFADEEHTVTLNGEALSTRDKKIFNPFKTDIDATAFSEPAVFEITLNPDTLYNKGIDFLQVAFHLAGEAQHVKFELYSGDVWHTVKEVSDNKDRYVTLTTTTRGLHGAAGGNPSKIRITVSNPLRDSVLVHSIVGRYIVSAGNSFLPKAGGKIFGDLDFVKNGRSVVVVAPDGGRWKLSVGNDGVLSTVSV